MFYELQFQHEERTLSVSLSINIEIENDGIGHYEFWGAPGYDHGNDYPVVGEISWDQDRFTAEENAAIAKYIDDQFEEIEGSMLAQWEQEERDGWDDWADSQYNNLFID